MLSFVLWVSDKSLRIFECVGWGKDGVEKLIEYKKLKKIWISEMELIMFYRGISNIDVYLLLLFLVIFWSEVEYENESSEILYIKYLGIVLYLWSDEYWFVCNSLVEGWILM